MQPDVGGNVLGDWYATALNAGAKRLVVWVNEATNLTVVTPARNADFPEGFPPALEALLLRVGVPPQQAAGERAASSEFAFARTRDRSMLGSVRDTSVRVRQYLERGLDARAAEDGMAAMPVGSRGFLFPKEVVFARFGLKAPAHLAAVEDLELDDCLTERRPRPTQIRFTGVTPILRVADFDRSVAYYVQRLGFRLKWRVGGFGCVSRGKVELMLSEGAQGRPGTWCYVSVNDADALYSEYVASGATIRRTPVNYPWGAREMHVTDPDGHVLRFGSDAVPDEPLGDWIDEDGGVWSPQPDGTWRNVAQ
jgi:catechol 2,3-dioxygenase-like lactoylglutathione lyase family enzyme